MTLKQPANRRPQMTVIRAPQSEMDATTERRRRERFELAEWVLDFLRRDLNELKATDWSGLLRELDHLTWKLVGGGTVFPVTWLKQLEAKRRSTTMMVTHGSWRLESTQNELPFLEERHNERKFRARLPKLTRKQLRQLQSRLRHLLDDLRPADPEFEPAWPRIMYPSIPGAITRVHLMNDLSDEPGLGFQRVYGADWRHLRWLAIAALLEEFGAQIIRCEAPECTHLFLRNRRQQYCSRPCSQRVRSTKWYNEHRETAKERRRQVYKQQRGG